MDKIFDVKLLLKISDDNSETSYRIIELSIVYCSLPSALCHIGQEYRISFGLIRDNSSCGMEYVLVFNCVEFWILPIDD